MLPDIVAALAQVGIVHPFPIQQMSIPIALTGTDMIGQARTGTGKTLAFGITALQRIVVPSERDFELQAKPGAPQALIVTPTRELALQVSKDLTTASSIRKARVLTVYGGVGYEPQLDALAAGVEVVVGTPGRLLDLADRGSLDLSHIKVLVLDEADEMLDLGFLPDVERILAKTPELRQTMLFSATMPSAIVALARHHLRHPVNIRAESSDDTTTVPTTAQFVYQVHDLDKPEIVSRVLQAENRNRVMVFCRTKRAAQRLADDLAERGFSVTAIHGDLSQVLREKALKKFRSGAVNVLVATDVAARGIDVEGVTHVINYECPDDDKTYVHRIGRTGRAGASGVAITFVDWADVTRWKVINNTLDLPFAEPEETYSTSDHLYHDLGIDRTVTGRLVPLPARERPARDRDQDVEVDDAAADAEREKRRCERPKRQRTRRRLRNGVPVEGTEEAGASETGVSESTDTTPEAVADAPVDGAPVDGAPADGDAPTKRRRRRRRNKSAATE
ncbi:putative ATP-dependent RNA helicase [Microlunatus phosphovorus NM-1]|uniref:RNA helicase n=1 Tax=Microlunatus phosphovorus (strain ATCC 700054 / DSM 10555 / JCM 9379 / NBRC 101784 / NCIMB 13414 / VKM Ac-1990 / NM-1) TaxID=1032480 RepID=F5XLH2_MICPN|nr:putative ATP-dependent RNA helicase [Microlunatus phosphovorus NM-1]